MVAARHTDVDDLNRRARRLLAAAGALGDDVTIGERPFAVRDDEEHHSAQKNDDLIERLRQTVNRSDAKTSPLRILSQDVLQQHQTPSMNSGPNGAGGPIVNRAPHPPFDELAALERDQQRAAANLAKAHQEQRAAQEALEELSGHRRLTRRRDRQQAEQRLDRAAGLVSGAERASSRWVSDEHPWTQR